MKPRVLPPLLAAGLLTLVVAATAAELALVTLTSQADRVRIEIGGELFTEYVFGDGASRPYCHPILAPDGTPLTRDYPMKETPGEDTDHPWHRSLWFAHSEMGGVDFWNEGTGGAQAPKAKGRSEHRALVDLRSGPVGELRTRNDWVAPDGRLIAVDDRTLRFHADERGRFIDFEITLQPAPGGSLLMGDNKDGTMAVRVAQWMTLPHKYKGRETGGSGHLLTAGGDRDDAAWGKRAAWCDYYAERNGQTYGIAIFDHPENLRHPTWWMARGYGLFGANPFGQHDYENLKDQPNIGDYTIPRDGRLTLRYRLYFHLGDPAAAQVARRYQDYAAGR